MNIIGEHLSKSFDHDLQMLMNEFLRMGGMAEENLRNAVKALVESDSMLAEQVIKGDKLINQAEQTLDEMVVKILAKRQPAATDLRMIMAISKANVDMERIGDEAKKIAKMARRLAQQGQAPLGYQDVQELGDQVVEMLNTAIEAFAKFDVTQAIEVLKLDPEIDSHYKSASRSLLSYITTVESQNEYIPKIIDIMWSLRALERIGAHASNIAEQAIYCISGNDIRYQKQKAQKIEQEISENSLS